MSYLRPFLAATMAWAITFTSLPSVHADDADTLNNVVNGNTLVVVKIQSDQIDLPAVFKEAPEPVRNGAAQSLKIMKQLLGSNAVYLAADLPYATSISARLVAPEDKGVDWDGLINRLSQSQAHNIKKESVGDWGRITMLVGGNENQVPSINPLPGDGATWAQRFSEMKDYPVQLVIAMPEYFRQTITELDPQLPKEIGGGSSAELISQFRFAHLAIDPGKSIGRLTIDTGSDASAKALAKRFPKMLASLAAQMGPEMESSRMMIIGALGLLRPDVEGKQLVVSFEDREEAENILQIFGQALQMTMRPIVNNQNSNNLKQLALAFHNYESAYRSFPPAKRYRDEDGKSGLSWRVHILPFIEQANLYNQFKLDEPWDSEHNIKLLDQMPEVFKLPSPFGSKTKIKPNHTVYVGPVGENTLWSSKEALSFRDILDGTSNTIMYVQVAPEHAVPWTAPQEYEFDPNNPAGKLGSEGGKTTIALMDGSVQRVRVDLPAETWKALFTINGGEVVDVD